MAHLGRAAAFFLLLAFEGIYSSSECNANGVYDAKSNTCVCDKAWRGDECERLALLPLPHKTLGTIYPGINSHTTSSWGGSVILGEDGLYHLLVAEFANSCGLATWQSNSFIRHAVAETVDGNYQPREVVMGVYSHNPTCIDATPAGGPKCLLLHIGSGQKSPNHPIKKCSGGFSPPPTPAGQAAVMRSKDDDNGVLSLLVLDRFGSKHEWRAENITCAPDKANNTKCNLFDNAGGFVDPDGTTWVNFVLRGDHNHSGHGAAGFGIASATSWRGPFVPLSGFWDVPVLVGNGTAFNRSEDGFMWRDKRGSFHMIFHFLGTPDDPGDHGGHAFADQGALHWTFSPGKAFDAANNTMDDPTFPAASYAKRQRPHLLFDEHGEMTHLLTGVCLHTHAHMCMSRTALYFFRVLHFNQFTDS